MWKGEATSTIEPEQHSHSVDHRLVRTLMSSLHGKGTGLGIERTRHQELLGYSYPILMLLIFFKVKIYKPPFELVHMCAVFRFWVGAII